MSAPDILSKLERKFFSREDEGVPDEDDGFSRADVLYTKMRSAI